MHCPRCNAEVDAQAKFCPECGASLTGGVTPEAAGSPASALRGSRGGEVEDERTLWEGGYSAKAMVGLWLLLGVISIGLLILALLPMTTAALGWTSGAMLSVVLGAIVLLWLIGGAVLACRRLSVHYTVTTQRLVHRHGLISQTTDRIELIDVDDIRFTQGPVERMLGVGTIQIKSSDASHPDLELRGIDAVRTVSDIIDDARRKERRRRGIHIENI